MKINRQIRTPRVRLIDQTGKQVGIVLIQDAIRMAESVSLDLVEMVPNANPPVCKILDYGKYRYDQTKKEKDNKKSQHQIKVKEVKMKPNIDTHDFETKLRRARDFITKGNKVKITVMFRGREMTRPEVGRRWIEKMCECLEDLVVVESPAKQAGRMLSCVIAPAPAKKKKVGIGESHAKNEDKKVDQTQVSSHGDRKAQAS